MRNPVVIVSIILLALCFFLMVYGVAKFVEEIDKTGLKTIVERVWEGPKK